MQRDYRVYLDDILEAASRIQAYMGDMTSKDLAKDQKTSDAVIRNLEVIGEAVKNIPDEIRIKHPQVEWKKIAALRNVLIHEYFGIDTEIICDIVCHKLPILIRETRHILEQPFPEA